MARLPEPGKDSGEWGDILNDFLLQSHTVNGGLRSGTIQTSNILDGVVTENKLSSGVRAQLGVAGPQGPIGATGPKGDPGDPATNIITSVAGKVGAVILNRTDVGLSNIDNTSDLAKPVSTATQLALDLKVDKVTGKGLSTEDFTSSEKTKLAGIETAADVTSAVNVSAAGAVMNTGDQNIAGIKTFSNSPTIPEPTTDSQASNKKYVDDRVNNAGDVKGPTSASLSSIAAFDSTTGKLIKSTPGYAYSNGQVELNVNTDLPVLRLSGNTSGEYLLVINSAASAASAGAGLVGGMINEPTATGHRLGYYLFKGGSTNVAGMQGMSTQAWSGSAKGARIEFLVTGNNTTARTVAGYFDHNKDLVVNGGLTTTGKATIGDKTELAASTASRASLNIASGTTPTTPNNGDIWFDGASLKIQINGVTRTITIT